MRKNRINRFGFTAVETITVIIIIILLGILLIPAIYQARKEAQEAGGKGGKLSEAVDAKPQERVEGTVLQIDKTEWFGSRTNCVQLIIWFEEKSTGVSYSLAIYDYKCRLMADELFAVIKADDLIRIPKRRLGSSYYTYEIEKLSEFSEEPEESASVEDLEDGENLNLPTFEGDERSGSVEKLYQEAENGEE
jgi:hypothetical protein